MISGKKYPCHHLKYNSGMKLEIKMLTSQGLNAEQGINAVHMTNAQPECVVAAEHLGCIEKIAIAVRGHIVVGKCHEYHLAGIHE
jgi:hypothetical protein